MSNERGFTLPELVVTTVVLIALFGAAAYILAPAKLINEQLDIQRKLHIAALVQGVNRLIADVGEPPPFIPAEGKIIGSSDDEYDLCLALTSLHMPIIPLDPVYGSVTNVDGEARLAPSADCDVPNVEYTSGYRIAQDSDGTVSISGTLVNGQKYTLRTPKQK